MAAKSAATPQAAGVRTPGSGAYSDPTQVGAMIQKMYPQYANFDPTTLGQRWIDVHTPQAGAGSGVGTDVLTPPTGTTPLTSTDPNQNTPDLSGLGKFATPVKQQAPAQQQPQVKINMPKVAGMSQLNQGNQLASAPQNNTPWFGSQIASAVGNFFKAPDLQAQPLNKLGF